MGIGNGTIERCLIDTGLSVNVLPHKEAQKLNLVLSPAPVNHLEGFDGSIATVDGEWRGEVQLGPSGNKKEISILVVDRATCPILGIQSIRDFGLTLNFNNNTIGFPTGQTVSCMMIAPKNE